MNTRKYGKKHCHLHTTPWHLHSAKAAKTNAVMATAPSPETPPLKKKASLYRDVFKCREIGNVVSQ